jgi:hypothetical protein
MSQVYEDSGGKLHIRDLFAEFNPNTLPDKINQPTLARLNQFLNDDLGLAIRAPEISVRAIFRELGVFNTRGTLCWDILNDLQSRATSLIQPAAAPTELQRVASLCGEYIFTIVESVDLARREEQR